MEIHVCGRREMTGSYVTRSGDYVVVADRWGEWRMFSRRQVVILGAARRPARRAPKKSS